MGEWEVTGREAVQGSVLIHCAVEGRMGTYNRMCGANCTVP